MSKIDWNNTEQRKKYDAEYFQKNKVLRKNQRDKKYKLHRAIVDAWKECRPCTDCGIYYPSVVMDFDHGSSEKVDNISNMLISYGLDSIVYEMMKCEVVCANCHRLRTFSRV